MDYKIVEQEGFQIIGVKKVFSFQAGQNLVEIPKFWEEVWSDGTMERLAGLVNGEVPRYMGICSVSEEQAPKQEMDYWIAVDCDGEVPVDMGKWEIPSLQWAVFPSVGALPDAIQQTWQKIYAEWLPASGYEHGPGPEIEVYGPGDNRADDYECEVWIPVIKK
ncbi:AraC family transcriptional regulator [Listeria weihenstephanensis]|uniref:AraC family transcriptional regulator n=1 Tax=Listeria weihenstephanensis TaxID=1006155 RepID=A0A841Z4A0_9LIST|nr:GyrI-like domain-containing protein [Listeria weihenstephanensis]MBC1500761.1 AraC family transcriptional regulator [Listeria weihenstephanensis]